MSCPICKGGAFNFGRHFKPPKKSDNAQWKKIEYLVEHGFVLQTIYEQREDFGCYKVSYPKSLAEAKYFVVKLVAISVGMTILFTSHFESKSKRRIIQRELLKIAGSNAYKAIKRTNNKHVRRR